MDQYREKLREINARPIRKIAEWSARKKKKLALKIEKIRKKWLSADNDMSAGAKTKMIWSQLKKAKAEGKRKEKYSAVKKGGGATDVTKKGGKGAVRCQS